MFIMTREKNDADVIRNLKVDNPRFDIDEIRRVKALIRFQTNNIDKGNEEVQDLNIIMKFGRCTEIFTIGGALYALTLRVAGKEEDTIYKFRTIYLENGQIDLALLKKEMVAKFD